MNMNGSSEMKARHCDAFVKAQAEVAKLKGGELLVIYADGLDASMDGRGYGAKHEAARLRIETCVDTHEELIVLLETLAAHVNLKRLNVRKDFSLINAHACAQKLIAKVRGAQ